MKILKNYLIFLFLFSFFLSYSQIEVNGKIEKPGQSEVLVVTNILISENLSGPTVVKFYGESLGSPVSALKRAEMNSDGSSNNSFDELETRFSGEINSPELNETTIFESKTAEELSQLEIEITPSQFGSVPPNIRGIIASRLAQIGDEFPPQFTGNLFGKIISSINKVNEQDCGRYFDQIFEELLRIKNEDSPEFPPDIYNRVVEEIVLIKEEHCQGYSLFLSLEVEITSKPVNHELSDDTGVYNSVLNVSCEPKNE